MTEVRDKLAPGAVIAGDYLVLSVERAEAPERCFLATDRETDHRVRVAELPSATAGAWAAAAIEHPGVVELVAVLSALGGSFGVFAEVEGATVSDELARVGRLAAPDAVGAALRVAEALTVLHRAGVVHGAVGPASVVLKPSDQGKPVLGYAPPSLRPTGYRAPDRRGLAPAREDDLWATGALLYHTLTGQPPPEAGLVGPEQVVALDVADELLVGVMVQALAADPNRRSVRIASMRHPLGVWLERRAAQRRATPVPPRKPQTFAWTRAAPSSPPGAPIAPTRTASLLGTSEHDSSPVIEISEAAEPISAGAERAADSVPPEPPASSPPSRPAPSLGPTTRSPVRQPRTSWMIGGAAVLAIGVIAVAASHSRSRARPSAPRHAAAVVPHAPARHVAHRSRAPAHRAPPKPAPRATAAAPHPVSVGQCVAAHSPPRSFAVVPDLDWMCKTTDPRQGAQRMHAAVVIGAGGHSITSAMRLWGAVTWYGMAAFAALRGACCPSAPPLQTPSPGPECQPLSDALNDLSRRAAAHQAFDPSLAALDHTILCELGHHREHVFWQSGRLHDGERTVLDKLLEPVQHPQSAPAR